MTKERENPRIALVGCGRWGLNHLKTWRSLGNLDLLCDEDASVLERCRKEHPGLRVTASFEEVLASPEIDGIVIATPAATHYGLALEAMKAGKDVLVEKPMALHAEDGRRLIAAAEKYRRILMVGHVLEYHPAVRKLGEMIRECEIGKVRYIASNRQNFGAIRTEENALWSFAPHDIAVMLRLLGCMPDKVACHGGEYLSPGIADVTLTVLGFPNNVHGHIYVSWLYPFKVQRFVVVGEKKMAVFDDTKPWPEKLVLFSHEVDWVHGTVPVARKAEGECVALEEKAPLEIECAEFLRCIRTRENPLTDGRSALKVLEVLDLATRSYNKGGIPMPGEKLEDTGGGSPYAHPTATIDEGALIGEGTKVWHYSHVSAGAVIGRGCVLGQNVFVGSGVRIGDGVRIQNNVSVYQGVTLEDHVFCGPSMVFTNVLNPRAEVSRKDEFKPTLVRKGATLGANCTIVCGNRIGEYAFIAAGAVVTKDVPGYALMMGSPAKRSGWMCACGVKLGEDLRCACGRAYRAHGQNRIEPA